MIKGRCYRCGFAFALAEQFVANALAAEGVAGKPSHYAAECPRCRQVNKLSLRGARLPHPEQAESAEQTE